VLDRWQWDSRIEEGARPQGAVQLIVRLLRLLVCPATKVTCSGR
jgi:hypothetical protein